GAAIAGSLAIAAGGASAGPIALQLDPASSYTRTCGPNTPTIGAPSTGVASVTRVPLPGDATSVQAFAAQRAACTRPPSIHATSGAPSTSRAIAADVTSPRPRASPSARQLAPSSAITARRAPAPPTIHAASTRSPALACRLGAC